MKFIKMSLLLFFILQNLTSIELEIKDYKPEKYMIFPSGDKDNCIGLNESALIGGGTTGPMAMSFDDKDNMYICDGINNRIVVYKNKELVKIINNKSKNIILGTRKIYFDNKNNLILFYEGFLKKINTDGEEIFNKTNKDIINSTSGMYDRFILIDDEIIYYDYKNNPVIIDSKGKIMNPEESKKRIDKINKSENKRNKSISNKEKEFLNNKKIINKNNRLLTREIRDYKEYLKIKDKVKKNDKINIIDTQSEPHDLIGYDKFNNSYWNGRRKGYDVAFVLDPDGYILSCIKLKEYQKINAIDNEGNLYYMEPDEEYKNLIIEGIKITV